MADRATIANMAPEYGATCGFFPVDEQILDYLRLTGRPQERIALVEAYCKENALWHESDTHPEYSQVVDLDLDAVEPSLAGPRRPQDRVPCAWRRSRSSRRSVVQRRAPGGDEDEAIAETFPASDPTAGQTPATTRSRRRARRRRAARRGALGRADPRRRAHEVGHGSVVIAAITSCTNTSNPQVIVAAGLLAKNAVERGLRRKPWVKSSLAPGSKVVTALPRQRRA